MSRRVTPSVRTLRWSASGGAITTRLWITMRRSGGLERATEGSQPRRSRGSERSEARQAGAIRE